VAGSQSGNQKLKAAPLPGALTISICPPSCLVMPNTVVIPSPVPSPTSFVVKKGSKIRARVAASIPAPVSLTTIST
jgi:hypothetical protein